MRAHNRQLSAYTVRASPPADRRKMPARDYRGTLASALTRSGHNCVERCVHRETRITTLGIEDGNCRHHLSPSLAGHRSCTPRTVVQLLPLVRILEQRILVVFGIENQSFNTSTLRRDLAPILENCSLWSAIAHRRTSSDPLPTGRPRERLGENCQ